MNVHEYQAKSIMAPFGVKVPRGGATTSGKEARKIAEKLGGNIWVVKAQIHAGGRGKGGGVKLAKSLDEVEKIANEIMGMTLITHQTGPEGKKVNTIYIEEGADIAKEYYLAILLDRGLEMPILMASTEGGMDIEEVAAKHPEKLIKVAIDPVIGFQGFQGRKLAFALGLTKEQIPSFISIVASLYEMYIKKDAEMIEVNPLILTKSNEFIVLDAKVGFDNNALYRQKEVLDMRDLSEEEPTEVEAGKYNLSYIKLDGNVACMVNGAGLAMATMDIIKHEGGEPANFLDVGGGASAETVAKGFEIILKDSNVKAIFVNIFGGIVRCDRVANGIIEAFKSVGCEIPVIVRLDGTNAIEAREILNNAGIPKLIAATDLKDGAKKAVQSAKDAKSKNVK